MDRSRLQQLERKAATIGLDDDEAGELGRLYAEAEGKPYSDAEHERTVRLEAEHPLKERKGPHAGRHNPFSARLFWRGRSLEIGQASTPAEDAERPE
jgi:hypothetical protein